MEEGKNSNSVSYGKSKDKCTINVDDQAAGGDARKNQKCFKKLFFSLKVLKIVLIGKF